MASRVGTVSSTVTPAPAIRAGSFSTSPSTRDEATNSVEPAR